LQKLALAVGWDDPAEGTRLAEWALGLIEPEREPRLELASRHALIWLLNDLPSLVGEQVLAEGNDVKILDRDT
jgi:hypothetical protein